jgi:probable rRNA maturation factor
LSCLEVDVVVESGDWSDGGLLEGLAHRAATAIAARSEIAILLPATVTVAFADDASVRRLNSRYRGQDKPTNVLSFPAPAIARAAGQVPYIGDVVLAQETVRREAHELGIPLQHHILHLLVHGILHLMGYDHETDADATSMETLETLILAALDVADPYKEAATRQIPRAASAHAGHGGIED